MIVTVTCTSTDGVYSLEVSPDMELENFRVLVAVESGLMERSDLAFWHNGRILMGDKKTLAEHNVNDNDVLMFGTLPQNSLGNMSQNPLAGLTQPPLAGLAQTQPSRQQNPSSMSSGLGGIDWSSIRIPGSSQPVAPTPPMSSSSSASASSSRSVDTEDPESIRKKFLEDKHQLSLLKERNPRLADAINSSKEFREILEEQRQEREKAEMERIRLLAADPFDLEAQAKIAEEIRMENVNLNMQNAMEHNPEAFGEVYMLYINCKINGHPVKAFVDSGAQMTIMSRSCAQKCNIMHLIDHRWQGMAVGVGKQKIIGRVHMGQMQIEDVFLSTSLTILEHQPMDILLGLDMLKRHQCCIDLKKNALLIGTTGTETPFLSESELPECARLNRKRTREGETSTDDIQEEEDRILAETLLKSQQDAAS